MAREKNRLSFEGELDYWAPGGLFDTGPRIADRDVIGEIEELWPWRGLDRDKPCVRVLLGAEPIADGPLWAYHGFGGTDVTPPEAPEIKVGGIELLERLRDLDGRTVALVIEDA